MSNILINKRFNERVKLVATALNNISIAFVISAVIYPLVREGNESVWSSPQTYIWILTCLAVHCCAHVAFRFLKSEE